MTSERRHPTEPDPDAGPDDAPDGRVVTAIELPGRTIVRVLLVLAGLWLALRLWQLGLLLILAMMLAAALDPAVRWLQRLRVRRTIAVGLVVGSTVLTIVVGAGLLVPPLVDEGRAFAQELPARVQDYQRLLEQNPDLYQRVQRAAERASADPSSLVGGLLAVGLGLVAVVSNALILLVLTIYILVDGGRIYAWLVRYLPERHRRRLDETIPEASKVVSGYVAGQIVTSVLFGVFTFVTLTLLGVPQPLFLAVIAAVADAIPIAGVLIATAPAVVLALTVSPAAAGIVLVAYVAYQQVENYLIVPRVYRRTLQISSFAVLVAVLIGGTLLGILGVLLALPAAAAVPVIEKIWVAPGRRREAEAVEATERERSTAGWPA